MVEEVACPYGSMKPGGYRPRIVDGQIRRLLEVFGGVEVRGTKWCGKTWSALAAAESVIHVDMPKTMPIVSADPAFALRGAPPMSSTNGRRFPPFGMSPAMQSTRRVGSAACSC